MKRKRKTNSRGFTQPTPNVKLVHAVIVPNGTSAKATSTPAENEALCAQKSTLIVRRPNGTTKIVRLGKQVS